MVSKSMRTIIYTVLIAISFTTVLPVSAETDKERKKRELQEKIRRLQEKKRKEQEEFIREQKERERKAAKKGSNLEDVIARYEKLLANCSSKKSARCADVMVTLAKQYYDQARDQYIKARSRYEKEMDEWERNQSGPEPINPKPNYSKSIGMYKKFAATYPDHPKVGESFYQLGSVFLVMGNLEESEENFRKASQYIKSGPRYSAIHFRLGDFEFIKRDYTKALKHFEKVNPGDVNIQIVEMSHYRKAECYYNMADFDKAVEYYFSYREKCDQGEFTNCEFREGSVEFMAIAFSDMGQGGEKAERFFKRVGGRPYEDYVLYTIGLKNRKHGQYDDAIHSLQVALQRFPNYKDAPLAQQMLVECYLVKKQYDKANEARAQLVDLYQPGTEWFRNNEKQKIIIAQAKKEVRHALASIAIYYHAMAQEKNDRELYKKALDRYLEFFQKFSDDKWRIYEFNYNVAEIYNTLQMYEKAAKHYDYVAMQDLNTYPKFEREVDTVGLSIEEIEELRKKAKEGPQAISQEDAGYNVIVALDKARKKKIAEGGLTPEAAYALPITGQFINYIQKFARRFPRNANVDDVLYLGANVQYEAKAYQAAIDQFNYIINNYPTSKLAQKSLRMLANSYAKAGNFDLAMAKYRELLSKTPQSSPDYKDIVNLAAAAIYNKAEAMKKSGNLIGAADAYKSISKSYPTSSVADRGWFNAAVCYEEGNNFELAANAFELLPEKFPKSNLREKAFVRAAEAYKKESKWEKAAMVYRKGADAIKKPEFAIGSLANAAEAYQKIKKFDLAGKMFETIYERYSDDPKTPQALYNAGLIFEKGLFYPNAIKVYTILHQKFPKSEYSAEAYFSIGLCYEKMKNKAKVAEVFSDYAQKYPTDRYKQVQALAKSADAYYELKNMAAAEKNYTLATVVYKEYGKTKDIDVATIARCYFQLGEMKYKDFAAIKLTGRYSKTVKERTKEKTKVLADAAKMYARAVEVGVEEWTLKSTYRIGQGFVDMAEAVRNQKLFGTKEQQVASKIRIISSLEKYYEKAQGYFLKNIDWAYEQNIQGEHVDMSKEMFMKMLYLKGHLLEEVGLAFKEAPLPRGLTAEEKIAYRELLEEKYLEALDAALPKYEESIAIAKEVGIAKSQWLDKLKERIRAINPASEALNIVITERKPKVLEQAEQAKLAKNQGLAEESKMEYDRSLRRIRNIMNMNIRVSEKIKQLKRIEMEAKRNIIMEEEKIKRLQNKKQTASR